MKWVSAKIQIKNTATSDGGAQKLWNDSWHAFEIWIDQNQKLQPRRRFAAALLPRLFGNNVRGHTTRAPPLGFELVTKGIQFYAIANLDKTSLPKRSQMKSNDTKPRRELRDTHWMGELLLSIYIFFNLPPKNHYLLCYWLNANN